MCRADGATRLEAEFECGGHRYAAVGYARIESGPGVDGKVLIEDVDVRLVGTYAPGVGETAREALLEEWRKERDRDHSEA